jgi:hypothetical protein
MEKSKVPQLGKVQAHDTDKAKMDRVWVRDIWASKWDFMAQYLSPLCLSFYFLFKVLELF